MNKTEPGNPKEEESLGTALKPGSLQFKTSLKRFYTIEHQNNISDQLKVDQTSEQLCSGKRFDHGYGKKITP